MKDAIIQVNGIDITVVKSKQARSTIFSVKPFKMPKLTIPYHTDVKQAVEWLHQNENVIKEYISRAALYEMKKTVFKTGTAYKTAFHTIQYELYKGEKLQLKKNGNALLYAVPDRVDFHEFADRIYIHVLKIEAKDFLPERVKLMAEKFGFPPRKVVINSAVTRWGSCSSTRINLSLHIMRLPGELRDMVILHELAHTKVQNHSKTFYKVLDAVCPDRKNLDKKLKQFDPKIY